MKKKLSSLFLATAMVLTLAACGTSKTTTEATPTLTQVLRQPQTAHGTSLAPRDLPQTSPAKKSPISIRLV